MHHLTVDCFFFFFFFPPHIVSWSKFPNWGLLLAPRWGFSSKSRGWMATIMLVVQKNKQQKLRNTKRFFSAQNNPEVAWQMWNLMRQDHGDQNSIHTYIYIYICVYTYVCIYFHILYIYTVYLIVDLACVFLVLFFHSVVWQSPDFSIKTCDFLEPKRHGWWVSWTLFKKLSFQQQMSGWKMNPLRSRDTFWRFDMNATNKKHRTNHAVFSKRKLQNQHPGDLTLKIMEICELWMSNFKGHHLGGRPNRKSAFLCISKTGNAHYTKSLFHEVRTTFLKNFQFDVGHNLLETTHNHKFCLGLSPPLSSHSHHKHHHNHHFCFVLYILLYLLPSTDPYFPWKNLTFVFSTSLFFRAPKNLQKKNDGGRFFFAAEGNALPTISSWIWSLPEIGSDLTWLINPNGWLILVRSTPHPVTVTTRIITFLVGNPYKPSFATVTGWGVDPIYWYKPIERILNW